MSKDPELDKLFGEQSRDRGTTHHDTPAFFSDEDWTWMISVGISLVFGAAVGWLIGVGMSQGCS